MRLLLLAAVALSLAGPAVAADGDRFQIVKATDSRVWRLDRQTGEVSVCTLQGERLLCATSSEAVTAPQRSYEQINAERSAADQADKERQLAFLDKVFDMFRELMRFAVENDSGNQ
jgi:hypothetical protein